jgi:hypothetical protein
MPSKRTNPTVEANVPQGFLQLPNDARAPTNGYFSVIVWSSEG